MRKVLLVLLCFLFAIPNFAKGTAVATTKKTYNITINEKTWENLTSIAESLTTDPDYEKLCITDILPDHTATFPPALLTRINAVCPNYTDPITSDTTNENGVATKGNRDCICKDQIPTILSSVGESIKPEGDNLIEEFTVIQTFYNELNSIPLIIEVSQTLQTQLGLQSLEITGLKNNLITILEPLLKEEQGLIRAINNDTTITELELAAHPKNFTDQKSDISDNTKITGAIKIYVNSLNLEELTKQLAIEPNPEDPTFATILKENIEKLKTVAEEKLQTKLDELNELLKNFLETPPALDSAQYNLNEENGVKNYVKKLDTAEIETLLTTQEDSITEGNPAYTAINRDIAKLNNTIAQDTTARGNVREELRVCSDLTEALAEDTVDYKDLFRGGPTGYELLYESRIGSYKGKNCASDSYPVYRKDKFNFHCEESKYLLSPTETILNNFTAACDPFKPQLLSLDSGGEAEKLIKKCYGNIIALAIEKGVVTCNSGSNTNIIKEKPSDTVGVNRPTVNDIEASSEVTALTAPSVEAIVGASLSTSSSSSGSDYSDSDYSENLANAVEEIMRKLCEDAKIEAAIKTAMNTYCAKEPSGYLITYPTTAQMKGHSHAPTNGTNLSTPDSIRTACEDAKMQATINDGMSDCTDTSGNTIIPEENKPDLATLKSTYPNLTNADVAAIMVKLCDDAKAAAVAAAAAAAAAVEINTALDELVALKESVFTNRNCREIGNRSQKYLALANSTVNQNHSTKANTNADPVFRPEAIVKARELALKLAPLKNGHTPPEECDYFPQMKNLHNILSEIVKFGRTKPISDNETNEKKCGGLAWEIFNLDNDPHNNNSNSGFIIDLEMFCNDETNV